MQVISGATGDCAVCNFCLVAVKARALGITEEEIATAGGRVVAIGARAAAALEEEPLEPAAFNFLGAVLAICPRAAAWILVATATDVV